MALRKDKKQVIGEPMSDEQVRRYLSVEPPVGIDRDYHCLERAYRGLRVDDFERFLHFFLEEGRNPRAMDPKGRTLAEVISGHASSAEYLSALRNTGAA